MLTSTAALVVVFVLLAGISIGSSSLLVSRIERLGSRLHLTEAILGLVAATAADAPEITSALTALVRGQRDVSVSVVLGANVFQLASLLGLGAVVARGISLHRRVVAFEGLAAVWIALVAFGVVARAAPPQPALVLALAVFVPYVVVSAMSPQVRARLPQPPWFRRDVTDVIAEEEAEISEVIGPVVHRRTDLPVAVAALLVVVFASAVLERVATSLAGRWGLSDVVLGGIVLAVVTSLPNLVAAIYLARRGRGAATLSEAMNSNRINTLAGLLIPAAIVGTTVAAAGSGTAVLAAWYLVMTIGVLTVAYVRSGLSRITGVAILATYGVVIVTLLR